MAEGKRIVIVGGVAGGASAAARARRLSENATITMLERGEHISFANCGLPYHIGGAIADRSRLLVQTPEGMRQRFRVDVHTRTEVVRIDRARKEAIARDLATGAEHAVPYDALVLSPGAESVRPPIPGIGSSRVFTLRSLREMDAIKKVVDTEKPERAVVIGGGYIGLEMAEALRARGLAVTLIELSSQVMGPADPEMAEPLHQELRSHGVDLRLGTSVTEFREEGRRLEVHLSTGETVACGLAVLAIGVKPETRLAREAGLAIGERGGIVVDAHLRTSDPDIYALGDAVEVRDFVGGHAAAIPLAGPANRQGRIAADNILGRDHLYRRTQGTAICKVFDLAIGMTGMSEKALARAGRLFEKVYVHPASHASYYPGAHPISLKLLFDPADGKILGAQAVGASGVDKRIDVLAVALRAGMTVFDLEDLELAYAPPYGSAKDPVNYAGFVAANALRGEVRLCHTPDVAHPADGQQLLDVRTDAELATGTLPGALHIPLDDLRDRLGELPRDKEYLVFCQVGLRGYVACRILSQHGLACRNLTGGYKTYLATMPPVAACGPLAAAKESPMRPTGPTGSTRPTLPPELTSDTGTEILPRLAPKAKPEPAVCIDATGLQCPGPIMRLKAELDRLAVGQALAIDVTDPSFAADAPAWCHSTGNEFAGIYRKNGSFRATIIKRSECGLQPVSSDRRRPEGRTPNEGKGKTIVVFSSDFDRAMAAFIIANGAAAMGSPVTLFFTFWGLNVLRKPEPVKVKKTLIERMFGWMMPRGAKKLTLSKMHMAGMGTAMMQGIMRRKHVASLPELIESAKKAGVRLVACSMSMDLMGIKREELIDGVEEGGVAMYLDHAEAGNVNLFI